MKVTTCLNFEVNENMLTANNGEIITTPDQALTPQQLVARYATGNLQGVSVNDYYFDVPISDDVPVFGIQPTYYERQAMAQYINKVMKQQRYDETKKNQQNENASDTSSQVVDQPTTN